MTGTSIPAAERLIVALDVASRAEAEHLVLQLGGSVKFYKIGYQLGFAGGLDLARDLVAMGHKVFLDMKLLDIEHTVARAVENIAKMGVHMLTIHAYPKVLAAAASANRGSAMQLLGVSVLTSMDDADLSAAGYGVGLVDLVLRRALNAHAAGCQGVVASVNEARAIRSQLGEPFTIVTPGIRLDALPGDDQKRAYTPIEAMAAKVSHIVVGRPIIAAKDPKASAQRIVEMLQHG